MHSRLKAIGLVFLHGKRPKLSHLLILIFVNLHIEDDPPKVTKQVQSYLMMKFSGNEVKIHVHINIIEREAI